MSILSAPHETLEQKAEAQQAAMQSYYTLHAQIYDSTRWTFLFGRDRILQLLPLPKDTTGLIVEVGCGTGYNLIQLAKQYPKAQLCGIDTSTDMIAQSEKKMRVYSNRTTLIDKPYIKDHDFAWAEKPSLILFSYSLTMINPYWSELLDQAYADLAPGGHIAVVDFHQSPREWFKNWMLRNHVRMDAHILPVLEAQYTTEHSEVCAAYGGTWQYMLFIGKKA